MNSSKIIQEFVDSFIMWTKRFPQYILLFSFLIKYTPLTYEKNSSPSNSTLKYVTYPCYYRDIWVKGQLLQDQCIYIYKSVCVSL